MAKDFTKNLEGTMKKVEKSQIEEKELEKMKKELEKAKKQIEKQDKELKEKNKQIEKQDKQIEEKNKEIEKYRNKEEKRSERVNFSFRPSMLKKAREKAEKNKISLSKLVENAIYKELENE